ncbi:SulP family inorganic anion transporter [Marinomonas rhizomae]|uniref:SulP family sulfate permease n=1 Tax=Marinomonas rhizomae TaxID=491948 RepID=A0A366J947_9GAMM|nr:SulP family inorganic anion transporter [Marinomonas rhizomae]RBP83472.1 SulP family sulfate permease [Marinomonas rhizomae]RNF74025.1 SulP family inorganic anion transporter [Marinomonas rhizomae]
MFQTIMSTLFPFLIWLKKQNPTIVRNDIIAGITGAVLVLPQGVAYAYIAGLPPEIGLYTAIVSASIAALFGSSFHMISGPTAALSIVVASVIHQISYTSVTEQMSIVVTLSFLVGFIQFSFGALRLGALVNFISHTVIIGFTTGAALLIATSQIKHLFGIELTSRLSFLEEISAIAQQITQLNPYALAIGASTLAASLIVKSINKKLPNLLIGMVVGSLLSLLLGAQNHGVIMVESMPGTLPPISLPNMSPSNLQALFSGAFAVALLGLIEAASIARAISMRSKQIIDGNQEFIGQGMSNIVGGFFSCYPSSGSFTRSGANYDAGAVSPMSAVYAAIIVALVIAFVPSATSYLPLPAMAGSVLLIAWNLVDRKHIMETLKLSHAEAIILLGTFLSTLFIQLEFAIYVGIILSIGFYLRRTSRPRIIEVAPIQSTDNRIIRNIQRYSLETCPQIKMIRIDGSLYFGSVDYVQKTIAKLTQDETKYLIIVAKGINFMDVSGIHLLESEISRIEKRGGSVRICSLKGTVLDEIRSMPIFSSFLKHYLTDNSKEAISSLLAFIDTQKCHQCNARIFNECKNFPSANIVNQHISVGS